MSTDLHAQDAAARERARTRFHGALVLEAGAGSGKTGALVARIVHWCLGPGWARHAAESDDDVAGRALRGVTAITFTEAAAAEMAGRVADAFATLARGEEPLACDRAALLGDDPDSGLDEAELAERAGALLARADQIAISTIHGFCMRLLRANALEAHLHPAFEVDAEGEATEQLAREVLEARLATAFGDPGDEDWLALARGGVGPDRVGEALVALATAGARPADLEADPLAPERVVTLAQRLADAVRALHAVVAPAAPDLKRSKATIALAGALSEAVAALDPLPETLDAVRDAAALLAPCTNKLKQLAELDLGGEEELAFAGDEDALYEAAPPLLRLVRHASKLDPERLDRARRVLFELLTELRDRLHARGLLTHDDLLREAVALLQNDDKVLVRTRARIDQLLVDEFQDTDELQCLLVEWLALQGPETDRPGLFLVGDPKQSIYGWRNADLAAYERATSAAVRGDGEAQRLSVNFRSSQAVLDEVERALAPLMTGGALQPEFQRLVVPAGGAGAGTVPPQGTAAIEHWSLLGWDSAADAPLVPNSAEAGELEADAIAADAVALHDAGVAWKDMALLLRTTTALEQHLEAFKRRGVPHAVTRDRSYYRRREVIDAVSLVGAVLDPTDLLSLVAWLRSSAVGVPDAAWVPLWEAGLPDLAAALAGVDEGEADRVERLVRAAAARVDEDAAPGLERLPRWRSALVDGLLALAELRRAHATLPADRFVERLRARTQFEAGEAARFLGAFRLANLERFFRALHAALEDGAGDAERALRSLRRAVRERREAEEGRPLEAAEDAVQVMTIHKSKGLTFRQVWIAGMHRTGRHGGDSSDLLARSRGEVAYRLLGAPSLDLDRALERTEQIAEAEAVRLLYVAATRSKARVVFSGLPEPTRKGAAQSHADLLARRSGGTDEHTARLKAAREAGESSVEDEHGARWRFPALEERPEPAPSRERGKSPSVAAARGEAEAVATARGAADLRMRRKRGGAASADAHRSLEREGREARLDGDGPRVDDAQRVATAVGSAVHGLLERWSTGADLEALRAVGRAELEAELGPTLGGDARVRFEALCDRLESGPLLARLAALGDAVVARELPLLLPPDPTSADGPTGFVSGAIDLVYRDPETSEWVVVDHKTDRVEGAQLAERAESYRPQLDAYAEGLRDALGLDVLPRRELWFAHAGEVVALAQDPPR